MRCKRASLRALQDGVAQAGALLKTDCPTYRPVTSVVRIGVMEQRLDAMLRAINIVQPALQKIYGSLTDGQKERVNRDQRNASSAGSLVSAGCGSSQTTGHGHGLPSVAMSSQFSGFRASLFWVKITELERPATPKRSALHPTCCLGPLRASRSDACRAKEVPSMVGCSAAEQSGRSLCPGISAKALLRST